MPVAQFEFMILFVVLFMVLASIDEILAPDPSMWPYPENGKHMLEPFPFALN